jgi:hypothetical protein
MKVQNNNGKQTEPEGVDFSFLTTTTATCLLYPAFDFFPPKPNLHFPWQYWYLKF